MPSLAAADGRVFEIPESGCVIGRGESETDDLYLVDVSDMPGARTVSRRHARIVPVESAWYLRVDPEATNPVWVGDSYVRAFEDVQLADALALRFGDVQLTFSLPQVVADHEGPTILPGPSSTLEALGTAPIKRITPFLGMMVDERVWADAHVEHRRSAAIRNLALHGWGIAEGLTVRTDPRNSGGLLVDPGLAFDAQGRLILLGQTAAVNVGYSVDRLTYVVLRWSEEPTELQTGIAGIAEPTRAIEGGRVTVEYTPPAPPALELARIAGGGTLRNPVEPAAPRAGEVDLRFRSRVSVRAQQEVIVAQLLVGDEAPDAKALRHRDGLLNVLREVTATTGSRTRWAGMLRFGDPLPDATVLYLTGDEAFTPSDEAVDALRPFFAAGGVLLADACTNGGHAEFLASAQALAGRLGRRPSPVRRGHPLLTARHLFAVPPSAGPAGQALNEDDGFIISTADYGCLWQGGPEDAPMPREVIRAAVEIGVNAACFGAQRRRPLDAPDY